MCACLALLGDLVLGVVGDDNDYVEGVESFLLSGRSFPLMGSLMTAETAVSDLAAASDLSRDWWAAAPAQSFSRRFEPLWRCFC